MKSWLSQKRLVAVLGAVISLPTVLAADADKTDQTTGDAGVAPPAAVTVETSAQPTILAPTTTAPSVTATTAPGIGTAKLPYGVDDVLKLSRARINEDVTLNYIQNSGTIYNLSAQDLIYLKNEGVSDKVLNAMQDQRKRALGTVTQTSAAAAPALQIYTAPSTAATTTQPAYASQPIYVQEPTYFDSIVNSEPEYAPASTLYVIPYPTPTYPRYAYASSYPSYGNFGPYPIFAPPLPRAGFASFGGPIHGGPRGGVYHFGGGGGRRVAMGGSHGVAMSAGHAAMGGGHGRAAGGGGRHR